MNSHPAWFEISSLAFCLASAALLVSAFVIVQIIRKLLPLLDDTKVQIRQVGELSVNAVSRANDTMDLIEARVSQGMVAANDAANETSRHAVGVASLIAGIYVAARFMGKVRGKLSPAKVGQNQRRKRRTFW